MNCVLSLLGDEEKVQLTDFKDNLFLHSDLFFSLFHSCPYNNHTARMWRDDDFNKGAIKFPT